MAAWSGAGLNGSRRANAIQLLIRSAPGPAATETWSRCVREMDGGRVTLTVGDYAFNGVVRSDGGFSEGT